MSEKPPAVVTVAVADPTLPVFDKEVQIIRTPLAVGRNYADDIANADRTVVDHVVCVHAGMCKHRVALPAHASDRLREMHREHIAAAAMLAVVPDLPTTERALREGLTSKDAAYQPEYYEVVLEYPPNVEIDFNRWANVFRQDPVYVDPNNMTFSVDWEKRRILMRTRVLGHRHPRATSAEILFLETDLRRMTLPAPLSPYASPHGTPTGSPANSPLSAKRSATTQPAVH